MPQAPDRGETEPRQRTLSYVSRRLCRTISSTWSDAQKETYAA